MLLSLFLKLSQLAADKENLEKELKNTQSQLSEVQVHLSAESEQRLSLEKKLQAALQEKDIIISDKDTEIQVRKRCCAQ